MTKKQALKTAAARVHFINLGKDRGLNRYQVNHYSETHRAWWEGNITSSRDHALRSAWQAKVEIALELLGITDAGALANSAQYNAYPRDWRQVVREEVSADRRAREQLQHDQPEGQDRESYSDDQDRESYSTD